MGGTSKKEYMTNVSPRVVSLVLASVTDKTEYGFCGSSER